MTRSDMSKRQKRNRKMALADLCGNVRDMSRTGVRPNAATLER